MSLSDWLASRWLVVHESSPEEIRDLLEVVDRDLADAALEGLSPDWRLGIASGQASSGVAPVTFEVDTPILNSPFAPPGEHWFLRPGHPPERRPGRRPALVFQPRDQPEPWDVEGDPTLARLAEYERAYGLELVNLVRSRLAQWQADGRPGATRVTRELIDWWRRDGRRQRLFFAQLEAAETLIFLREARADYRQGIEIPRDEPGDEWRERGYTGFPRYACKMATGGGKTTVMAMTAAWSILNKQQDRANATYSDVVLVVCPNITIRDRLLELDPARGDASLYRTRDLVPPHLMPLLARGRVVITNWHVFEPQTADAGEVSARVVKAGVRQTTQETIRIAEKTTTARNLRYMTPQALDALAAMGSIRVLQEKRDAAGHLTAVVVERERWVESDTAVVARVLGREIGGKQNLLVMNDEAHHAYRIRRDEGGDEELFEGDDEDEFYREATVWVEGLDRVNKLRGINLCLDLSATPYFLGRVGRLTGRPFPWVVSEFGLVDAIESGLVKIPQLALGDTSGQERPDYFNIWDWIVRKKLTPAERGGKKGSPKPEAILKYAHAPIALLAGQWREEFQRRQAVSDGDPRPPVFIIVCKNIAIAKVVYDWLAEDERPAGIPSSGLPEFLNRGGAVNTIRVDTKVVHETDRGESAAGGSKGDEQRWMRFTLDTVGKTDWTRDGQGRALYPEGFEELAKKVDRPLHPPGRDVRCIVSVAMLTEGWDANTVSHIVGLRPFMSQLLCEQVVGRGLRRRRYDVGENDRFGEEIAQVLGVPFEVIPFKTTDNGTAPPATRHRIHAVPAKAQYEITFPRVERYTQRVTGRVTVHWDQVPALEIDPAKIPPEVELAVNLPNNQGRHSVLAPGRVSEATLEPYRRGRRLQELIFEMARDLTRELVQGGDVAVPAGVLFPQLAAVVKRYVDDRVFVVPPSDRLDLFLSPYYGWAIERLREAIRPDGEAGEGPELPVYERGARRVGSTGQVDAWTSKPVIEVVKSHVNLMVAHTSSWEQQVAQKLDRNSAVLAFVKNEFLELAIPYFDNGQDHEYYPDFLVRLAGEPRFTLILEVKGRPDPLADVKAAAARRWAAAVNAEGSFGRWGYAIVRDPKETNATIEAWLGEAAGVR
jgi:type III restriction enzyme